MSNAYKVIALLGGTGSLGHALTRYLLDTTSATIRIFSRGELLQKQMADTFQHNPRLRFLVGDIRDLARLTLACCGVDLVIHCAALKHIDTSEYDPEEFIKTNVYGTANVMHACRTMGVKRAVLISTDKSTNPVNTYGATKMLAERLWIQANAYSPHGTQYVAVRYGNVMGSRGSVLEVWRQCLSECRSCPITDTGMTRFFLTLPEAVTYAWYTACRVPRGCLFVPHLPAFYIGDLLDALAPDAVSKVTGTRPGEKLAEALLTDDEQLRARTVIEAESDVFGYVIPPAVRSWELNEALLARRGEVIGPYVSDTWAYRLGVEDLRMRLQHL